MADIVSARSKLNTTEVAQDKPVTEALITKIGADINYLIDERDTADSRLDGHDSDISAIESDIAAIQTEINKFTVALVVVDSGNVIVTDLQVAFEYPSYMLMMEEAPSNRARIRTWILDNGTGSGPFSITYDSTSTLGVLTTADQWSYATHHYYHNSSAGSYRIYYTLWQPVAISDL